MWLVWIAVGYVLAVLVPVPGVSRAIIDGWAKVYSRIKRPAPS